MKRPLLGLIAFAFLIFIGFQAAHFHAQPTQKSCHTCVLGNQAIRQLPHAVPTLFATLSWVQIPTARTVLAIPLVPGEASARSPPLS
ncbi:MAG: hypothetical protein HY399_01905 [Elusimicrobia bacterium]|nr:hypothetical protein [Elusimicrobiota bacterium]